MKYRRDTWGRDTETPTEVMQGLIKVAEERTSGLLTEHRLKTETISKLVESAYIQGIRDAVEVTGAKEQVGK